MGKQLKPERGIGAVVRGGVAAVKGAKAQPLAAAAPLAPQKRPRKTQKPLAPERVAAILHVLNRTYPDAVCALHHTSAWELTVATILSAQCTDARVNLVTPTLFRMYPNPEDMASASQPELEEIIRTTGFFRNKAKSIKGAAKVVVEQFRNHVPETMEELLQLPGVARKTANVVLGSWYGIAEGVVVDTHVLRLSQRLELTKNTTPEKVELDLMKVVPRERWIPFSHELIFHGRQVCVARKPRCLDCSLETLCNSGDKTWSSHSAVEIRPK